eukprot:CAMPEP_0168204324 /NCGR_PEP_ID=MMETSP0139_2-20121125/25335_1 /TAXON_ID=44445 /ORGANISM="Pseudo-nitzschia australis, Strain 10249 10 AB" /LENGTH=30 /DNA_ID= /DNA_START= /DNA_END= /DNA_ORIENTATION=
MAVVVGIYTTGEEEDDYRESLLMAAASLAA